MKKYVNLTLVYAILAMAGGVFIGNLPNLMTLREELLSV